MTQLKFFKFMFTFPSGGNLKGVVKGILQSDNNTVTNLSDLFAVYYASFIPIAMASGKSPSESLPPLVFDSLNLDFNSNPQFTLDGSSLISFSGTNNNGDLFTLKNDNNEHSVIINNSEIDSYFYNNGNINFNFQAEEVIYKLKLSVQLEKDLKINPNNGFPNQVNLEGFLLFPNNIEEHKKLNSTCFSQNGIDYPYNDFLFVFSDDEKQPTFALIPNGKECTLTAINPNQTSGTGRTNPINPDQFEFVFHWDAGYNDSQDTHEVLNKNCQTNQCLCKLENKQSQFILLDENGVKEAFYHFKIGTLQASY
jgi:hypothetical protein